jgi:hypothetical protein
MATLHNGVDQNAARASQSSYEGGHRGASEGGARVGAEK